MTKRVLVVGGGIIGLSVAHYCALKGHQVTVVERGAAERNGCSFANAGMIVPSHFIPLASPGVVQLGLRWMWNPESPFHVQPRFSSELLDWGWKLYRAATPARVAAAAPVLRDLHLASRTCFQEWAARWGNEFELVEHGLLLLCKTEHGLEEETRTAEYARRLGIPAEVLSPAAAAELEPNLRMAIAGAVYFRLDAHLTPGRLMAVLRRELQRAGTKLLHDTEVRGWLVDKVHVSAVETSVGRIEADEFVLCAGVWSKQLVRDLAIALPMQAGKGYSLTLPKPRQLPAIPAILTEARVAVTPMGSSLRFGGTMEIAGLDERINPARVRGIIKSVPRYYPDFTTQDFDGIEPWCGLRPCSPDGLPYIGRFGQYENLSVATGHAMMGLSLGPITGKLMADVLSDQSTSIPVDQLSPDRYSG